MGTGFLLFPMMMIPDIAVVLLKIRQHEFSGTFDNLKKCQKNFLLLTSIFLSSIVMAFSMKALRSIVPSVTSFVVRGAHNRKLLEAQGLVPLRFCYLFGVITIMLFRF